MTVVGNRGRISGFRRFLVVEYDSGGGLPRKVVLWPEIEQRCGGFVGFDSGDRFVDLRRGVMRKVELMERTGSMMVVLANARLNPANDGSGWCGCFCYFSGDLWLIGSVPCLGLDGRLPLSVVAVADCQKSDGNECRPLWTAATAAAFGSLTFFFFYFFNKAKQKKKIKSGKENVRW